MLLMADIIPSIYNIAQYMQISVAIYYNSATPTSTSNIPNVIDSFDVTQSDSFFSGMTIKWLY